MWWIVSDPKSRWKRELQRPLLPVRATNGILESCSPRSKLDLWFDLMCLSLEAKITVTFQTCFFVSKTGYMNTFHYINKAGWLKNNTGIFIMVIHSVQRWTETNLSKNSTFLPFSSWISNSRTNLTLIYSSYIALIILPSSMRSADCKSDMILA